MAPLFFPSCPCQRYAIFFLFIFGGIMSFIMVCFPRLLFWTPDTIRPNLPLLLFPPTPGPDDAPHDCALPRQICPLVHVWEHPDPLQLCLHPGAHYPLQEPAGAGEAPIHWGLHPLHRCHSLCCLGGETPFLLLSPPWLFDVVAHSALRFCFFFLLFSLSSPLREHLHPFQAKSYILIILFTIVQVVSLSWYISSYLPGGVSAMTKITQTFASGARTLLPI